MLLYLIVDGDARLHTDMHRWASSMDLMDAMAQIYEAARAMYNVAKALQAEVPWKAARIDIGGDVGETLVKDISGSSRLECFKSHDRLSRFGSSLCFRLTRRNSMGR